MTTALHVSISITSHVTVSGSFVSAKLIAAETLVLKLQTEVSVTHFSTSPVASHWSNSWQSDKFGQVSSSSVSEASLVSQEFVFSYSRWSTLVFDQVDIVGPFASASSKSVS